MGAFLSDHYAAGWRKVGTFTIQDTPNASHKLGGNVVAYFCTPDLKILHAVWGPVPADQFLSQAKWAAQLAEKLKSAEPKERAATARAAHLANPYRSSDRNSWSGLGLQHTERYDHLVEKVLTPLEKSAAELFQQLVDEKASDEEVTTIGFPAFGARVLPGSAVKPTSSPRRP